MTKKAALTGLAALTLAAMVASPTYARRGEDDDGADDRRGRLRHASSTIDSADLGCVAEAVAEREDALLAALDEFSGDAKAALEARKDDLAEAYSQDSKSEVRADVKTAWKTYRGAMKEARGDLKSAKKDAYSKFKADAKECGVNVESTDKSAPGEEILL